MSIRVAESVGAQSGHLNTDSTQMHTDVKIEITLLIGVPVCGCGKNWSRIGEFKNQPIKRNAHRIKKESSLVDRRLSVVAEKRGLPAVAN